MEINALLSELKELHLGRGVRRPDVCTWLGPQLQHLAGITAHMSDVDARSALVSMLSRHLATAPSDLSRIFRVASGITLDEPFLNDRLMTLEAPLQRSVRVLRRRLRLAEELLADSIMHQYAESDSALDDRGWQWDEHDMRLQLRDDATIVLRRTLLVLSDEPSGVHESFVVPNATGVAAQWTVESTEGFADCAVDDSTPGRWDLDLRLPPGLRRGQLHTTTLRVRASVARTLEPYFVLAPLLTVQRLRVAVDFGTPRAASEAWLIRAGMPYSMKLADLTREPLDIAATPEASISVSHPRPGYVYGIGWRWPDLP